MMAASKPAGAHPIGLWGAVAIGVGGMVGGGIFAVLGLSVQITKGAAPVAFLLAGLVALLTARSYALLSKAYPSRGGTVTFLNRTFGAGLFSGSINVLLWLSYIVMLALYSQAFGSYAASFLPSSAHSLGKHARRPGHTWGRTPATRRRSHHRDLTAVSYQQQTAPHPRISTKSLAFQPLAPKYHCGTTQFACGFFFVCKPAAA